MLLTELFVSMVDFLISETSIELSVFLSG